jgi:4,5-dihydroxyphthalate decarboxylase
VNADARVDLTLAMSRYDHVLDLVCGRVPVEGARLRWLELPVEEIFHRFLSLREWQASELSLAQDVSLVSAGDNSMVGLPVFPSRVFRHSAIYVRAGASTSTSTCRPA